MKARIVPLQRSEQLTTQSNGVRNTNETSSSQYYY
jgi:hypothetical protein